MHGSCTDSSTSEPWGSLPPRGSLVLSCTVTPARKHYNNKEIDKDVLKIKLYTHNTIDNVALTYISRERNCFNDFVKYPK